MRRADWVKLLWGEIEAAKQRLFSYGEHDCCLLVARVIDAMCDTKYEADLQAAYHDEQTAQAFLVLHGGMEAAVTSIVGIEAVPAILARRGDICLVNTQRGLGIGVSVGATIAVASDGVDFYPIAVALKCWRVD